MIIIFFNVLKNCYSNFSFYFPFVKSETQTWQSIKIILEERLQGSIFYQHYINSYCPVFNNTDLFFSEGFNQLSDVYSLLSNCCKNIEKIICQENFFNQPNMAAWSKDLLKTALREKCIDCLAEQLEAGVFPEKTICPAWKNKLMQLLPSENDLKQIWAETINNIKSLASVLSDTAAPQTMLETEKSAALFLEQRIACYFQQKLNAHGKIIAKQKKHEKLFEKLDKKCARRQEILKRKQMFQLGNFFIIAQTNRVPFENSFKGAQREFIQEYNKIQDLRDILNSTALKSSAEKFRVFYKKFNAPKTQDILQESLINKIINILRFCFSKKFNLGVLLDSTKFSQTKKAKFYIDLENAQKNINADKLKFPVAAAVNNRH